MFKKIAIWLIYLCAYEALALIVNKPIILPDLLLIGTHLSVHFNSIDFYAALLISLGRVVMGSIIALTLALLFGLLSYRFKTVKHALHPLLVLIKTLPNITYILLILVWFSREISVSIITLLIVLPVCYGQVMSGLDSLSVDQNEMLKIYPESFYESTKQIYIPALLPYILEAISLSLSLGFKVGVMAEILGQVSPGLGYELYVAKVNFDIAEVFALSIWMIIWVVMVEKGIHYIKKSVMKDLF